jgi:hypothetical protein
VTNQVDVKGVEFPARYDAVHQRVRSRVRAFLWNQADAPENAEDVRVEREDFLAAGEKESARDRFRADAPKL